MIPLDAYLEILRSATIEDNPFTITPEVNDAVGAQFVALTHALADFVDAARKTEVGYAQTRSILEDMVHTFPVTEDGEDDDPAAAIQAALLAAMGLSEEEAKKLFDL